MLSGLTGASEEHGAGLRITGQPPPPLLEELAAAAGVAAAVDTNTEAEPLCMTGHPLVWLEASAGGGVLPPVALQVLSARMTRPPANHDMTRESAHSTSKFPRKLPRVRHFSTIQLNPELLTRLCLKRRSRRMSLSVVSRCCD